MAEKLHLISGARGPRGGRLLVFHCPGCDFSHPFEVECAIGSGWKWNGSMERPTFTPSLLCNAEAVGFRCHSFVTDGRIQFLSDCDHALAGQTVELPDWGTGAQA
jgi:hypothetical protein